MEAKSCAQECFYKIQGPWSHSRAVNMPENSVTELLDFCFDVILTQEG